MTMTEVVTANGISEAVTANGMTEAVTQYQASYNWYVDSVNGDDDNAGTEFAPFATIAKLLTVWQAGQSVGLAKGSHWREQLTIPGDNCGVYAYGSGARPILDCSTVHTNALFSKTAGRTNVYQITVSTNYTASEPSFISVWENDTRLTYQSSLANCDANAGTYYMASSNATSVVVYVHASDSSDITANSKTYEIANRAFGIYGGNTGIVIQGIETRRNYSNGGSIKTGQATITDCVCRDGNSHNIYYGEGSVLTDVTCTGAYYIAAYSLFILNNNVGTGLGATLTRCTAELPAYDALSTGFYGHVNTSGDFGALSFTDCNVTNLANGFSYANCTTVTQSGGTATDVRTVHNFANSGITSFVVTGQTQANTVTGRFIFVNAGVTPPTMTVSGCTVTHDVALSGTASIFSQGNLTLTLTGNTFTNTYTAANGCVFVWVSGAGITLTINSSNNTFLTPNIASGPYIYYAANNVGAGITSNNNHFDREGSWFHNGTSYATLTLWRAGSGQDANSDIV